jgi:HPt (histidine-containing phosphotransfer) domain-containing protein
LARLAGNKRLYKKLLVQFHARQGASATDCQEALSAGDAEKANRIAHTLKGLAATIGADDLTACALALESASTSLPLSAEGEETAVRCFAELSRVIALLGEVLPELEGV